MTVEQALARFAVAWPIVSGILNVVLRTATAEEWIARGERFPRFAALTKLLRRYGVNPVGTLEQFKQLVAGKS